MTSAVEWPPLASLTATERDAVIAAASTHTYAKGDVVFAEGDPSDSVQLVVSGHLAIKVSTPDGDIATLNVIGPGAWFGELSTIAHLVSVPRSATVLALDATETLVLTQGAFWTLCRSNPGIERLVVELMTMRVREISSRLLRTMYVGLDRRVSGSLLDLARIYEARDGTVMIPLKQEDIAEMVGGTRPSVNQVLRRLDADGVIELSVAARSRSWTAEAESGR